MFHRTAEKYLYTTANIIVGLAELPFVATARRSGWVIPGGFIIESKKTATAYASRMNDLMQASMAKYGRKRL